MGPAIHPGTYKHHKGALYIVSGLLAYESTNDQPREPKVLYWSLEAHTWNVRRLEEFVEPVRWPDGNHAAAVRVRHLRRVGADACPGEKRPGRKAGLLLADTLEGAGPALYTSASDCSR